MTTPITLPPGAFTAAKTGQTVSAPDANAKPASTPVPKAEIKPKTITKKAEPVKEVPKEAEPPKDMTPAEKKIWKLKADGEEFEFDASDEEAVKREIMKARGADKRFKESASLRQQAEQFFQMLKDPKKAIEALQDPRIGLDFRKVAEDYIYEKMQEEKMTPEEKAQREKDRKLAEYEEREKKLASEKEEQENKTKLAAFESHYENKIMTALQVKGVPKTEETVSRMANYLAKSMENGYDLSPEELADFVKTDIANEYKEYIGALSEDQFVEFIGDHAEKLRKADLKRLKSPQGNPFSTAKSPKKEEREPRMKKQTVNSDWRSGLINDFLARK